ncbi:hypothetical protein GCM10010205_28650 [Streptomyces nojiriensis]|nr:hypothetical protein GCM10010205_28650 [Streptomyces nojiriensis]
MWAPGILLGCNEAVRPSGESITQSLQANMTSGQVRCPMGRLRDRDHDRGRSGRRAEAVAPAVDANPAGDRREALEKHSGDFAVCRAVPGRPLAHRSRTGPETT